MVMLQADSMVCYTLELAECEDSLMKKTLKGALGAALVGLVVMSPGTALAGAATAVPRAPKPKCEAAENQLCPPKMDVKAQPPRGYKIPKKPKGY